MSIAASYLGKEKTISLTEDGYIMTPDFGA